MRIAVNGKQMDVGAALQGHVQDELGALVTKYFEQALDATVVFSKEAHFFRCDITVHAGRGVTVKGGAEANDPYPAFDGAADRIGKQLRRWKRRLKDHKGRAGDEEEAGMPAQSYVLAGPGDEEEAAEAFPEDSNPMVVAEMPTEIPSCSVSNAVMRMDLADQPAMMFRNSAHGRLNVVYRRPDGNIGWIDPAET